MTRTHYCILALAMGLAACVQPHSIECELGTPNERTCPPATVCDDVHHLCVKSDQLKSCVGVADEMGCSIDGTAGLCHDEICLPDACGDGFIHGDEKCDGENLGGATCTSL